MMRAKIFCIGLSRTGTTTFNRVMSGLGFRACSGPSELGLALYDVDRFDDICHIVDKYDCLCDMPYPLLYERLLDRYPDSQFVLTTRGSEEKWIESVRALNLRNGPAEAFRIAYGCYEVTNNEYHLLDLYRTHNEEARKFFRDSDRFVEICWERGDGLQRIASLLGIDAASVHVPVANASADKNPRKIVERHCKQGRYGVAARYARSLDGFPELSALIHRSLDCELKQFLTGNTRKIAARRRW